jgi:mono/diheme cytochrome c family protein
MNSNRSYAAVSALAVAATLVLAASAQAKDAKPAAVERGRYLVNTSGCHDCHTPFKLGVNGPEPDMSRALSGHPEQLAMPPAPQLPAGPWLVVSSATNTAHAGPWGVSFTANLTPDDETGLGRWTQKNFVDTIRTGRHMGRGRPVLPPMPIPVYNNFSDADLAAIYAYLRTVPALKNRVPEPQPPAQRTAGQ